MKNEPVHHKKAIQAAFLAAYRTTASVTRAAATAGIGRNDHYRWLRDDNEYVAAFEASKEEAIQVLEDEAVRRAYEGVDEPQFWQGQICGTVKRYSDTMLIFLLKGLRPQKYRERWFGEISTSFNLPIAGSIDLSTLSDEEMKTLRVLVDKAKTPQLAVGNGDQTRLEDDTDANPLKTQNDPRTYSSEVDV